jgi:purine-binding chemotaxis protein CheW
LLFRLSAETYALPVNRVREILRVGVITRVPGAPLHVRGVTNLRGRILPVVELRTRITLSELTLTPAARVIVVEVRGRTLGILVDEVSDIVWVEKSLFGPPPREIVNGTTDYVSGVGRVGERLVLMMDLDTAMRVARADNAAEPAQSETQEKVQP